MTIDQINLIVRIIDKGIERINEKKYSLFEQPEIVDLTEYDRILDDLYTIKHIVLSE